uniref:Uncharacterized protein n=1 Tax=Anguilla anguilla TaxID=7936 RepID=A0A0E9U0W8_ANGAN
MTSSCTYPFYGKCNAFGYLESTGTN